MTSRTCRLCPPSTPIHGYRILQPVVTKVSRRKQCSRSSACNTFHMEVSSETVNNTNSFIQQVLRFCSPSDQRGLVGRIRQHRVLVRRSALLVLSEGTTLVNLVNFHSEKVLVDPVVAQVRKSSCQHLCQFTRIQQQCNQTAAYGVKLLALELISILYPTSDPITDLFEVSIRLVKHAKQVLSKNMLLPMKQPSCYSTKDRHQTF